MRRSNDEAIAEVIGAIVVLAVLGIALVYVNAYHVPKQGEGIEIVAAERSESALLDLAAALSAPSDGPLTVDLPLRAARSQPPLLSGVVLSPARSDGSASLDAATTKLTLSVIMNAPATGVPANDPSRVAAGAGKMRVYLLGSATSGQDLGTLRVATGGAYLPQSIRVVEGGAVLADTTDGSASVSPPSLTVASAGTRTAVSWRIPLLAGPLSEISGSTAQVALVPGPEAQIGGGGDVDELRLRFETPRVAAWQTALVPLVGSLGSVTTSVVSGDSGVVEVVVPNAKVDLFLVRYEVSLAERAG